MPKFASLAATALLAALTAVPVQAHAARTPICVKSVDLDRTTVVNPKKILFRLKDGRVYSSALRTPCLGLKFNGFVYETPNDEICGGSQTIRVLQTNEVCVLGPFVAERIGQHPG